MEKKLNPYNFEEISDEEIEASNLIKIIFLGSTGVGKTNLLSRFSSDTFLPFSKPTIGVDFTVKTIQLGKHYLKLQIWDTAGQERYRSFTSAYFKDCHGIFLVYDITQRDSFKSLPNWLSLAYSSVGHKKIPIILIGNKIETL